MASSSMYANGNYKKRMDKKVKEVKPGENVVSRKIASFWKDEVKQVDKFNTKYIKRGNDILKQFRDDRNKEAGFNQRKMNILWTNVKIMKPAIYNKCPKPIVDRKFSDKDPKGRLSSQILERNLNAQIEVNNYHDAISRAVLDYLLPGMGQIWLRYEPEFGTSESLKPDMVGFADLDDIEEEYDLEGFADEDGEESEEENQLESSGEQVISEKVVVDYIDWKDFYMFPAKARTWDEVQAIGKKVYLSRQEAIERFGEEIGENMRPMTMAQSSNRGNPSYQDTTVLQDTNQRDIEVYEIWNKTDRRVYWISSGYDYLCDCKDDLLKLKKFFPCPKPLCATMTNDTVIPVPDFWEWQDQAMQINELTQRIALLTRACKIAGTYDASNAGLKRLLNETVENELIPVDSWAMHAEKGGVAGSISFLPIKEIQSCIATLQTVRQQCKVDLDEITGLSDVLRGTTDSRETLGGLRLKNNNAGTRLQDRQEEVAQFAKEALQIMSEIACNEFDDDTLIEASGILFEEELQPHQVIEEYRTNLMFSMMSNPQLPAMIQQAQQPPPMPPQPPQMMPPGAPPQAGGNVLPFPGGAPQPPMGPQQPPPPPPDPKQIMQQIIDQKMQGVTPEKLIQDKIDGALKLLRDEITRGYRIDIETDSTVFSDKMQERQDAVEFIQAVTDFMARGSEMAMANPNAVPLMGQMLEFAVRKFRVGRDLESAIDEFVKKSIKQAKELELNPRPNPEEQKAKAETDNIILEGELAKADDERKAALDMQRRKSEDDAKAANDQRDFMKQQAEDTRQQQLDQSAMQIEQQRNALEMLKLQQQSEFAAREHALNMEAMLKEHEFKMEQMNKQKEVDTAKAAQAKKQAKQKPKAKAT